MVKRNDDVQKSIKTLSKKMEDDLRESVKQLVPKLSVAAAIDPTFEMWIEKFEGFTLAIKFMKKELGVSVDQAVKDEIKRRVSKLPSVHSPLRNMRREIKSQLCALAEQVQLIRALSSDFEQELKTLGAAETFDRVEKENLEIARKHKQASEAADQEFKEQFRQKKSGHVTITSSDDS